MKVFNLTALAAAVVVATTTAEAQPAPRGRIHLDYASYSDDVSPLHDGFRVRRARIGLEGSHGDNWSYLTEVDMAENGVDYKDMWLRYDGIAGGRLQVGQFKVPFSLEELTSSNNITFMERSLPNVFALSRRVGVGWSTAGDRYSAALMGFGQAIGAGDGGEEGLGFGGRVTMLPMRSDNGLLHLGFAAVVHEPEHSNEQTFRFRQRPESRPDGTRLIDTGVITDADDATSYGAELLWMRGPASVQAEYMTTTVSRNNGQPNLDFDGWYVYLSYFLTGESRSYSGGRPGGPSIRNAERGAWEIALRLSNTDLNDAPVSGGEMKNATLGLNWYPRSNVRFMFNYINVDSTRMSVDDDPSVLQMRAQVSF